ncbi:MAG: GAF domain-containing protein [Desulfobacterales bacterium]|nr:GAF domain-containing protein [Desulfobacterales bacterium]
MHFKLQAILLLAGWISTLYAVTHHRLLNRKIFVSRKVVYSFVASTLLAVYFIGLGIVTIIMNEFRQFSSPRTPDARGDKNAIAPYDPLVQFLETHPYFHVEEKESDSAWRETARKKEAFLAALKLTLMVPITIDDRVIGLIGLGPEFSGGGYGWDDFDLLTALASQTAAVLLAARIAEELAAARERRAWNRLSAFVLHDIKNAGAMLSLLRENAPENIHDPEFQQDMLELVDDALKRMGRVEHRLRTLKDEITPVLESLELGQFLGDCRDLLKAKLASMEIHVECEDETWVSADPALLLSIVENLLLNAFEAGGEGTIVRIEGGRRDDAGMALVEIIDNGPGIADELLPDILFEGGAYTTTPPHFGCGKLAKWLKGWMVG